MDPFDPLPAPQITAATPADISLATQLMIVLPVDGANPVGRLLLATIDDVVDEFGVPGPPGVATNGVDGVDGLSVVSVNSLDNGDGTLTLSWGRSDGAPDLVFTTPDLRGGQGNDGVGIVGFNAIDNGDGTLTFEFQRDMGALDFTFTTPDITGGDGVSIQTVVANETDGTLVLEVTLSDGTVQSVPTSLFVPLYESDQDLDRTVYPSGTNTVQIVRNQVTLPALPGGTYVAHASWKQGIAGITSDLQTRLNRGGAQFANISNEESQDASLGGVAGQLLARSVELEFTVPPAGQAAGEVWQFTINRRPNTTARDIEIADSLLYIERKRGT